MPSNYAFSGRRETQNVSATIREGVEGFPRQRHILFLISQPVNAHKQFLQCGIIKNNLLGTHHS